jgi:processive 1,2-diacylglycerol beta-glucosyltransferase
MVRKKILMLSVSAGSGHTRAAEALRVRAAAPPFEATAEHLDVLQLATPLLRTLYARLYMFLIRRAPSLWRWIYRSTNTATPSGVLHTVRRWAERSNCKALAAAIASSAPDVIICTHFLPAEMLSQLIGAGRLECPVWVQVTDFDLHRMWVHPHMAGYFAPNGEVAFRMARHGIASAAIHVTGIPIMPVFSAPLSGAACAFALGLNPQVTTVLLMGGGEGLGCVHTVAEHLLRMPEPFQLIALAGKDGAMLAALRALAARHPARMVARGYTDSIERLMACADLVVTKPGGLTSAEALAMGLPMIVIAPIPGQEECNANFLIEQGAALQAVDLATLEFRVRHLLANPAKLEAMRERATALGRPHAADAVLATALGQQG